MSQPTQGVLVGRGRPVGEGGEGLAFLSVLNVFTLVSWLKGAHREKTFPSSGPRH